MEEDNSSSKKKKNNILDWLLWWRIDKDELARQVSGYKTFKLTQSVRGQSTLLLLLSSMITLFVTVIGKRDAYGLTDVVGMLIIAFFIYRGYRWGSVLAMLYWSFGKIYGFYSGSDTNIITTLIWWVIYMHVFYLTFKVEGLRIKTPGKFSFIKKGLIVLVIITISLLVGLGIGLQGKGSTKTDSEIQSQVLVQKPANDQRRSVSSVVNIFCDNKSGGSGTLITEEGMVITNNHVIAGSNNCIVSLPDTTTGAPAEIYLAKPLIVPTLSEQYDIAMLTINGAYTDSNGKTWGTYPNKFSSFQKLSSCSNLTPQLGDSVRIYGYPVTSGGYNLTITDGVISSFADSGDILTSAKIDSGNSGGLAVNQNGCMIGIPSAVLTGNYQNLGVIIPNNIISNFFDEATALYATPTP